MSFYWNLGIKEKKRRGKLKKNEKKKIKFSTHSILSENCFSPLTTAVLEPRPPCSDLIGPTGDEDDGNLGNEINHNEEVELTVNQNEHPLKRRQTKSFELSSTASDITCTRKEAIIDLGEEKCAGNRILSKTKLTRSNDLLAQSTTETLLDLLKDHAGIKECNEETVQHINAVSLSSMFLQGIYVGKGGWVGGWRRIESLSFPRVIKSVKLQT